MNKLILTVVAGLACCTGTQAQIVWVLSTGSLGANGYLPKVAGDSSGGFIVVDQQANGTTAMNDQQGPYPGSGHTIPWASPVQLPMGTGHAPAIAEFLGNTEVFVEVHQGAATGTLYYHLGSSTVAGGPITWSSGVKFSFQGWNPAVTIFWSDPVAFDTVPVILIYQDGVNYSNLWSVLGSLNISGETPTITWGLPQPFDNGYAPSVTSCNENIIEVHEGLDGALMYSMALLDVYNGSIGPFGASTQYDTGYNPSIASCSVYSDSAVVEVHQLDNPPTGQPAVLAIKGGIFSNEGSSITWGTDQLYAVGCYPTVAPGNAFVDNYYGWNFTEVHSATCGEASALTYDFGDVVYVPN